MLDRNWQRLILTHLEEKEHRGVLTGAPITDMQITLLTGRAHQKHTEGGDFRQATYRAIRQGLKKAQNVLLEPYYEFRLEVPVEVVGRAMNDIQKMQGTLLPMETEENTAILKGKAPVSTMRDYQKEVVSYTRGMGRLFCSLKGYEPCKNQDEIVEQIGYDSERDLDNPTGSVFCAHGAGFVVPWYEVKSICTWILGLWQSLRMISVRKTGRMLHQALEILQVETDTASSQKFSMQWSWQYRNCQKYIWKWKPCGKWLPAAGICLPRKL